MNGGASLFTTSVGKQAHVTFPALRVRRCIFAQRQVQVLLRVNNFHGDEPCSVYSQNLPRPLDKLISTIDRLSHAKRTNKELYINKKTIADSFPKLIMFRR